MKLLLTGAFRYTGQQFRQLRDLGFEISYVKDETKHLSIDVTKIDAVVCNSLFLYNDISKFKSLKVIQLTSAGLDRVPIEFVKRNKIKLYNASNVYSIPMAEHCVLKILEIYKKSRKFYELQKMHKWEKQRDILELTQKTVAIIGFGNVGKEVAKRLKPFEVRLIGVGRRFIHSDLIDEYRLIDEIDLVLKKSDIIILTLPLTDQTHHLINEEKINIMKDYSVLINVSRGKIIDESALIKALKRNKFLGVALDVFEEEPLSYSSYFWSNDRVIITPHNSYVSQKNNQRLFNLIYKNLKNYKQKYYEVENESIDNLT